MATIRFEVSKPVLEWVLSTSESILNEKLLKDLKKWIVNETNPTINQIKQLSRASRIPFGYFFLQEPPKIDLPLLNFRTVNNNYLETPSKELLDTLYAMQAKVEWLNNYRVEQGADKISFIGLNKQYRQLDVESKAREILKYFDLSPDWNVNQRDAFKKLRNRITDYGITVEVNGVVGNTHRNLNQN